MNLDQYIEKNKVSEPELTNAISKAGIAKYDESEVQKGRILKALQDKTMPKASKLSPKIKIEPTKAKNSEKQASKNKSAKPDKMTKSFWDIMFDKGFSQQEEPKETISSQSKKR